MGKPLQLLIVTLSICYMQIHTIYALDNLYTSDLKNVYFMDNEQKYSWFDALAKCVSMNMSLATVDTKEKSDDLTALLRETFANVQPLWIGAVANGKDRHYVWISNGNTVTYTNWNVGQPDFYNNNEYCLQTGWSNNIQWNDHECHRHFGVICEYDENYLRNQEIETKLEEALAKEKQLQKELDTNQLLLHLLLDHKKSNGRKDKECKKNHNMFFNIN